MSGDANSTKVVVAALAGNLAIAISKFVAAFFTGSAATLAEAVHSVADTGNQALLLFGMKRSVRPPTEHHPFGSTVERYFWPFIVSVMLFVVGGAFAIYEGVHKLAEVHTIARGLATEKPHSNTWSYAVLGLSCLFEMYSFSVAFSEFKKLKGGGSTLRTMVDARDPTIPLVMLEDLAALAGLVIALIGIGLSDLTGWQGWDGVASVLIGVLLGGVAVFLARETHSLILGESALPEHRKQIAEIAAAVDGVRQVRQVLTVHRGPDEVILALKIDFDESLSVRKAEERIDLIETRIREQLPMMRYIFIEPDSTYSADHDPRTRAVVMPS